MADEAVKLNINGKEYEVGPEVTIGTRLVSFIRDVGVGTLMGTRTMCFEGGCGSCTVVVAVVDPSTGETNVFSVNSCLALVHACNGWDITTIEGLGSRQEGYHILQKKLAEYSGTQCGFCSPGMVMNMFGLTQSRPNGWTPQDVERNLDGNLCRCTGYRPILDAFKSVTIADIEEASCKWKETKGSCYGCPHAVTSGYKVVSCRQQSLITSASEKSKEIVVNGISWFQPTTLQELYDTINSMEAGKRYRLVGGNTGAGMFKSDGPYTVYIYTRLIPALTSVSSDETALKFGASVPITSLLRELEKAVNNQGFSHVREMIKVLYVMANTSVRNLGSWAGNLALKCVHNEFNSDLFAMLLAAGATVTTAYALDGTLFSHSIEELLKLDLEAEHHVILELSIPSLAKNMIYRAFKVAPRNAAAVGHVTATFCFEIDDANGHVVSGIPLIVYGGISADFVRASETESFLNGKNLEDISVVREACQILAAEVVPDNSPLNSSPTYRLALTQNLLYKTVLSIVPDILDPSVASGITSLERPVSQGSQDYDLNQDTWPVGQPIPKIEAYTQCAGEATFINDMPFVPGELYGAFVTSNVANAAIVSVDSSLALTSPGVVGFVGVEDINGKNNISVWNNENPEEVNAKAKYFLNFSHLNECPIMDNQLDWWWQRPEVKLASGARLVKVTYDDIQPPVLTIEEALQKPLPPGQPLPFIDGDVAVGFAQSSHIIEGSMSRNSQFHLHMETHITRAVPTEDGLDVVSSTQWSRETQACIAQVLGISTNSINLEVKRLGGAFGAKITRGNILAAAACLAAHKVGRPVRLSLDLSSNMTMIGWRDPFLCDYKVGVDSTGHLQAVQVTLTDDAGYLINDASAAGAVGAFPNCYHCPNWELTPRIVLTNTPSNTWCRTPATVEGITFMENIMDHVAAEIGVDPLEFRRANLIADGGRRPLHNVTVKRGLLVQIEDSFEKLTALVPKNLISDMIDQIIISCDLENRQKEVTQFNSENRWKKKGIAVMPMLWPYEVPSIYPFNVIVSIYAFDGTVAISHGGSECGQGMNTKVAQVAAYELGVPLDLIKFKASNMLANANSDCTGGSIGSNTTSYCVGMACKKLRARLDEVQEKEGKAMLWPELIRTAFSQGVDLTDRYYNGPDEVNSYNVFGVACTELELDVLTGQFLILRADILEDCGKSMSPLVDIGQVEGSYVFGQGLFTTEEPIYDSITGARLSNSTLTYKPPTALDIPIDMRVTLLKNAPNPVGVQSSKVSGEPPLCLSFSLVMALRQAVMSARQDAGITGWVQMDCPLTVEKLSQLCLVKPEQFTFIKSK